MTDKVAPVKVVRVRARLIVEVDSDISNLTMGQFLVELDEAETEFHMICEAVNGVLRRHSMTAADIPQCELEIGAEREIKNKCAIADCKDKPEPGRLHCIKHQPPLIPEGG